MSIETKREQITTNNNIIAENTQKVFSAGQKSMVDESKFIPITVTGSQHISLNNVSEIPHDVYIHVEPSTATVQVQGKNLLSSNVTLRTTLNVNDGSLYSPDAVRAHCCTSDYIYLKKGVYTLQCNNNVDSRYICFYDEDKVYTENIWTARPEAPYKITIDKDCYIRIDFDRSDGGVFIIDDLAANECMLELGATATTYEPYVEPMEYTPNENGEVVCRSASLNMYVYADADITLTYNKSYGIQKAHDDFWDAFQHNGAKTAYDYAFYRFPGTQFYPKYDIKPTNMTCFMQYFAMNEQPIDLAERFKECGIVFDTSSATSMNSAFYWRLGVTRLPEISYVGITASNGFTYSIVANEHLVTIDKIIFSEDGSQPFTATVLQNNKALENVTIEGVIGKNMTITSCDKLSHDSIMSIINHLKDYNGSGTTYTLTLGSYNLRKISDTEKSIATQKGWTLV